MNSKEALYYKQLKNKVVQCQLCPRFCTLKPEETGNCGARKNISGKLISLTYNHPCSIAIDPIEKKPFYHFLPGEKSLSIATVGCNLHCLNCQNSDISQCSAEEFNQSRKNQKEITPEQVIETAKKEKIKIISYTYTEPTIFYEYMLDIAKLAKKAKIKNVIVSNGYINPKPLRELCKYIDAANIDLKSISDDFYKKICQASVKPVLETLKILKEEKVWIEITNLIIPELNDSEKDINQLISWIKTNIGTDTPLHFSAFFPTYKLIKSKPTDSEILKKARETAIKQGMKYVYLGNIRDNYGETTICPNQKCKKQLIKREGFYILDNKIKSVKSKGICPNCKLKIAGIFEYK
jgi:pyruvate formate lyase activating enzyme